MSRRRSSKQDSLELLLDTICNTFGGVLFIAILVVLLLQQTGAGPAATASVSPPMSPVEIQSLAIRMETIAEELPRLRLNRDSQDAIVQSFAPDAIRQMLATRTALNAKEEALQTDVDQRVASLAQLVAGVEVISDENDTVRKRLDEAKERLNAAKNQLDKDRQSRVQEVRLPVLRTERGKTEIGLVMRYERLYVWHEYDSSNTRLGLNTRDFVVIGEAWGGLITRPNPTRGVLLDESESSQEAVRRVLRQFDPKECYLAMIVRPDSHGVFRHVRDRALELGFEYRLMPVETDEAVTDRGGTGGQVQ